MREKPVSVKPKIIPPRGRRGQSKKLEDNKYCIMGIFPSQLKIYHCVYCSFINLTCSYFCVSEKTEDMARTKGNLPPTNEWLERRAAPRSRLTHPVNTSHTYYNSQQWRTCCIVATFLWLLFKAGDALSNSHRNAATMQHVRRCCQAMTGSTCATYCRYRKCVYLYLVEGEVNWVITVKLKVDVRVF